MDYMYVWEHCGGHHVDVTWNPIFEDVYNPKLDLGYLCNQCVIFSTLV